MKKIALDTPTACLSELERCSTGLSQLTQEATRNREALGVVEEQMELVEAIAAAAIRDAEDTKLTATEVKGRITDFILSTDLEIEGGVGRVRLSLVREAAHSLRTEAQTLDRRLRTLEKRSMNAQSSLKAHDSESRNAAYQGGGGI